MSTERSHNVLVYRDNATWRALAEDLKGHAYLYVAQEGKGTVAADDLIIQVFPEGTPEADIEQWVTAQQEPLRTAKCVHCDGTTRRIMATLNVREVPDASYLGHLDGYYGDAAREVFKNASPTDVYRKIFTLLVGTASIKRVRIVLDHLADYNPLLLQGFDGTRRPNQDELTRYAEEFKKLIPPVVAVEFIRISNLTPPDEHTVVICHHHALNQLDLDGVHGNPRVLMPYPRGLFEKANSLCDISSVAQGDFLETMRKLIRPRKPI